MSEEKINARRRLVPVIVTFLFLIPFCSIAQVMQSQTKMDSTHLEVVKKGMNYLLSKKQPEQISYSAEKFPESWNIYDTFYQEIYDAKFRKDSNHIADSGFMVLSFQKLLLYNIDLTLDVIPRDSIVVKQEVVEGAEKGNEVFARFTWYSVCYKIDGKLFTAVLLLFTKSDKLLAVLPYIDFDEENKGIDIEGFYRRWGFDKIKGKLYDFSRAAQGVIPQ
jgi:hypothetical protein